VVRRPPVRNFQLNFVILISILDLAEPREVSHRTASLWSPISPIQLPLEIVPLDEESIWVASHHRGRPRLALVTQHILAAYLSVPEWLYAQREE